MKNKKLASLRTLYEVNQSSLATVIGVSVNTFSSKERGITNFTQPEMIKITKFFKNYNSNVTMDDIFFENQVN